MSKCSGCPAEIMWCKTASGKWTPVDIEPNPDGNLTMNGNDAEGIPLVKHVDLFTPADATRMMPHWSTCPNAEDFKSK